MAHITSSEIKRVIGRIQRLCAVVSGQQLIPTLMEEIRTAIPFSSCFFFWAGLKQELTNAYADGIGVSVVGLYLKQYQGGCECKAIRSWSETIRTHYPTAAGDYFERILKVPRHEFYRSDFYNLVLRPVGADRGLMLRIADHGQALGELILFRRASEPEFTSADNQLLEAITGFVAHAIRDTPKSTRYAPSDDHALLIANREGIVQHMSDQAHRLLLMALFPQWTS
ncbi:MAG: hypothetical protein JO110_23075, partial [Acetobacteraceae bacterium]|nr:hypothetical protein [Acetobacteraceae bacterium]